jgi:hypothetical protein
MRGTPIDPTKGQVDESRRILRQMTDAADRRSMIRSRRSTPMTP